MKVALAIETDSPGGAEVMLLELARGLLAEGVDVFALGPLGGEGWLTERLAACGVHRELLPFPGPFGLGAVSEISRLLAKHRPDVLHSHEFMMSTMGAFATRGRDCRHVITMHGGVYFASNLRRRASLRLAAETSDHMVAVSQQSRVVLSRQLLLRPDRIEVVPNGVTPRKGTGSAVRRELGLQDDQLLLLAVGSLYPVKGHVHLIEALSLIGSNDNRVRVAIAGQGGEESRLRALADDLGVASAVHFLGFRSDVPELLDAADVFVMPSLSEGMPMAMIEAMLASLPIVSTNVGGIPELLTSPDMGVLVDPSDPKGLAEAIRTLVDDPEEMQRLGRAARERALAHFTSSTMVERYLELYRR